jgi:hypothetical protein
VIVLLCARKRVSCWVERGTDRCNAIGMQHLQRLAAALNHRRYYDFMKAYFPTDKSEP